MILIVMYDSPFVRRAAVTLHHYGLAFDRRPISVFRDFADVQAVNPLGRLGGPWLCADAMTQADVTAAIAHTNLARKSPGLLPSGRYPALESLAERWKALACFRAAPLVEG